MKDLPEKDEFTVPGVKLGIVRLGRCAGKMKYTLLDERDISLAREYLFEARLEIDRNGNGAQIYAYAYNMSNKGGPPGARYLHELVWEKHFGPISPEMKVSHKNSISMDNRLENLCLLPRTEYNPFAYISLYYGNTSMSAVTAARRANGSETRNPSATASTSATTERMFKQLDQSLYWAAIHQLPAEHLIDEHFPDATSSGASPSSRCLDANGDVIDEGEEDDLTCYYECHYPPCIRIEREPREFSLCGRCQDTRYCGTLCQQRDWPIHKRFCREKQRQHSLSGQRSHQTSHQHHHAHNNHHHHQGNSSHHQQPHPWSPVQYYSRCGGLENSTPER